MRLIDADKLIEKLRDFKEWENDDGRPIHTMSETQRIDRCINFAQTEPTAYDIDKVVEELRENASRYTKKYTTPYGNNGYKDTKAISVHKAIEIVKRCGVSDDVCEWKYTKEIMDNAEFKVGCNQNALKRGIVPNNFSYHDFKYCPYCGKKIKVVE